MIYKDRIEAALKLTNALEKHRGQDGVVVAIPRGGLPVGYVLAKYLNFPLDVVLIKKIGHPQNHEYAIGSLSLKGRILSKDQVVPDDYIEGETQRLRALLDAKYKMYYKDRNPTSLLDKIVVVTDDGVATGKTLLSAIDFIRKAGARKIVAAIPVASPSALSEIKSKVDELIYLQAPRDFHTVSNYYSHFEQVTDELAVAILEKAQSICSTNKQDNGRKNYHSDNFSRP